MQVTACRAMHMMLSKSELRACLAGLLSGSGSGSSRGALQNIFVKKPFVSKKQRSQSRFDESTICGFTKALVRSSAK